MNIAFIGSIRGGRAMQPEYAAIVSALQKHGTVFSSHISDESLSEYGETQLSAPEIFARERQAIADADIVVAEVTTPSLGVGYLIAVATSMQKKVAALYSGEDALKLSSIIKGDPLVMLYSYKDVAEAGEVISRVIPLAH